jgi:sporulation protein YlmC with PRC-barrel domain
MEFRQGANIFTKQGQEVGQIDRVVIHPKTRAVTDIVIKGRSFPAEKVVPVDLVTTGKNDEIVLQADDRRLQQLPNFEERRYVVVNEQELGRESPRSSLSTFVPMVYLYPPYPETAVLPPAEPAYAEEVEENIPEGTVAVKEGAKVVDHDGKTIGNVEQVLTAPKSKQATHFVVSQGLLRKTKRLVPVEWIDTLEQDQVRLAVTSNTIKELRKYDTG